MHRFTIYERIIHYPMVLLASSEGPDQTVQDAQVIKAFDVLIRPKVPFLDDAIQSLL